MSIRSGALLAVPLLLLAGCGIARTTATEDVPLTGTIGTVALDTGAGDVSVRYDPGVQAPQLVRRLQFRGERPGPTHTQVGERLELHDCPGDCSVDHELVLPTDTATVTGTLGAGEADLVGVAAVDLTMGSGDATLRDVAGAVDLTMESGEVVGDGLRGDTSVLLTSGSVRIGLLEPASVRVRATSGDVAVTVPRADYAVRIDTGSGERSSDLDPVPGAPRSVDLETGSGDVELGYR